jgi:PilZ domain
MANTGQFAVGHRGTLQVELNRPGVLGMFRAAIPAECLEFSVDGIDVRSPVDLKVGQQLVIDLQMHDLRVEELAGTVRSVSVEGKARCYRIQFRTDERARGNTLHCLRHIETHVRQLSHAS